MIGRPHRACEKCNGPLVPHGRTETASVPVNGKYPFALQVKGLPTLQCERCGALVSSAPSAALVTSLYESLRAIAQRSLDDARRYDAGQVHLYGPETLGLVEVALATHPRVAPVASEAEPSLLRPVAPLKRRLNDLILHRQVKESLADFLVLARGDGRVARALGERFRETVQKRFLNLWGPPGVGKTMIARVLAFELALPLFEVDFAELESSLVGETEKNLRQAFELVREKKGILFIDEADSLVSRRLDARNGHEQSLNQTRNQLIRQLNTHDGIVIFASNFRRSYDPAIARRLVDIGVRAPDARQRRALWAEVMSGTAVVGGGDERWIASLDALVEAHEASGGAPDRPFGVSEMDEVVKQATARTAQESSAADLQVPREAVEAALRRTLVELRSSGHSERGPGQELAATRIVGQLVLDEDGALVAELGRALADAEKGRVAATAEHKRYVPAAEATIDRLLKTSRYLLAQLSRRRTLLLGTGFPGHMGDEGLARLHRQLHRAQTGDSRARPRHH